MLQFLAPILTSVATSLITGGINGLMGGGQQQQQQAPQMVPGVAPKMREPMDLTQGTSRLADGGLAHLMMLMNGGMAEGYAGGGIADLYGMDEGGMIRGPGSGVDDKVAGSIDNRSKVLLSDGEFVVPARVVSALGDGSSEHGAKVLHGMISRVKAEADDRLKDNGKINLKKVLPA